MRRRPGRRICSTRRGCSTASKRRSPTSISSTRRRRASAARSKRVGAPAAAMAATALAAGEKRGVLFGPERTGLDNRRGGARRRDRHVSGQSRLCLAQPRAGGAAGRLRMVQGGPWRRAAAARNRPRRLAAGDARDDARLLRILRGQARRAPASSARPPRSPACSRNLRNMFHRMAMTQQDVRTLWGAVVRLVEGPRVEVQDAQAHTRAQEGGALRRPKEGGALRRA